MQQGQVETTGKTGDALAEVVRRLKSDPHYILSATEIDLLLQPGRPLLNRKFGILGLFKAERYAEALPLAKSIAKDDPSEENLKNLWVLLLRLNDSEGLMEISTLADGKIEPIDYHSLMTTTCRQVNNPAEAIRHGDLCLEARDRKFAVQTATRDWKIPKFDRNAVMRNIIAFSVFGNSDRYLTGALNNAVAARYVYPSWVSRFYVDKSTPPEFRSKLQRNGAQVVVVEDLPAERFGTQWRFLVEDDPGVDFYIVRDADSVVTAKEALAVADWVESDKAFHIMRDNFAHTELILAGMWGARRGNIGNMRERIVEYDKSTPVIANYIHKDQHFLREQIWPVVRGSVCIHDRMFNFMNPHRFDPRLELPRHRHIGQNDWVHYKSDKPAAKAGA